VVIVRHPVVVALGTAKWLRGRGLGTPMANWFAAHDTFVADLPHLRQVHVLRYEELSRDPATAFAGLGRFLGLDGPLPSDSWQGGRSEAYARRWAELARDPLPWRRGRRAALVREYAERAAAYGYDLE